MAWCGIPPRYIKWWTEHWTKSNDKYIYIVVSGETNQYIYIYIYIAIPLKAPRQMEYRERRNEKFYYIRQSRHGCNSTHTRIYTHLFTTVRVRYFNLSLYRDEHLKFFLYNIPREHQLDIIACIIIATLQFKSSILITITIYSSSFYYSQKLKTIVVI